jgi:hypothetical protein
MPETIVQEFANRISGQEYPLSDKNLNLEYAKANNLVIAFGASDDLLEFRGAIHEEVGAYDGVLTYIINSKVIDDDDLEDDISTLRKYGFFETLPKETVEAIWCESDEFPNDLNASWLIKVNGFESAPFDVMEDGELYCRGAVLLLK